MRSCWLQFGILAVAFTVFDLSPQTTALAEQAAQRAPQVESRMTLSIETFCSETKLRTSNARLRWSIPQTALSGIGAATVSAARQSLEATVYKNGFEKNLLVSLPIGAATADRPIVPQAQGRQPLPRAFQLRLIDVQQPGATAEATAAGEMTAVVENLEPGVTYTWRIAIDTPSGRIVSPSAASEARVCPADMVQGTAVPRRKK
ncbi:MAG TPA: hypothetical protein VHU82_09400 [Vicinamibacterales bacterium]|jgi:hypothetical protein|nr:hypothetical protein [Vicinamibacterales bacterium]